ncbi:MAG TPA: hypothetical protein VG733_19835 [Chthoniobacteraceae bacterium]|nr:hypothetical protein [Chthoniobacteraceae bacterium]
MIVGTDGIGVGMGVAEAVMPQVAGGGVSVSGKVRVVSARAEVVAAIKAAGCTAAEMSAIGVTVLSNFFAGFFIETHFRSVFQPPRA